MTQPLRSGMQPRANASRRSRAIAAWSGQWPSRTTASGSHPHRMAKLLRSGMRSRANASRRSRTMAAGSAQWPSRTTASGSHRYRMTQPLRSGMRPRANASRRSILGRHSIFYHSILLINISALISVLSSWMYRQLQVRRRVEVSIKSLDAKAMV
jgi:hypothetical protein